MKAKCSVEGCERPQVARGYCKVCHQRSRRAAKRAEQAPRELKPLAADETIYSPPTEDIHLRLTVFERRKLASVARRQHLSMNGLIRAWIRGASLQEAM